MTMDLVKSVSIAHFVQQRDAVVERIRTALGFLMEAGSIAAAAGLTMPRLVVDNAYTGALRSHATACGNYADRGQAEAAMIRKIDCDAWEHLLTESGLRSFMDSATRRQWSTELIAGNVVPLTAGNIEATFTELYLQRDAMLERGVARCFRTLCHTYRSNGRARFDKRIVVTHLMRGGHPDGDTTNVLDDLVRALHVLDGKPMPDSRFGVYELVWRAYTQDRVQVVETDYLHLRWFKNGNAHVRFKRMDLVDKVNAILARQAPGALPAAD